MKKIIPLLIVPIVVLSIVSGLLFNQLVSVQNENSKMKNELFEANTQLEEEQSANLQLNNQITELENQLINATNKVKITEFIINMTDFPVAGVGWDSDFYLTVENFGINKIENLTAVFNIQHFKLESYETYNFSQSFGTLEVGESKTLYFRKNHGYYTNPIVATLMVDEVILDKKAAIWSK